jgi:hypothetical protein
MIRRPHAVPWTALIGLMVVIGVVSLASCQSLRRLRPPYHEPAIAPLEPR